MADRSRQAGSFMGKLAADRKGNVLAMSAAALIPLLAMIGGAIDASRIYMAHTRLQQACDAGALAGRKAMNNVTALTQTEQNKAKDFFNFNFPAGTYQAQNITSEYHKGNDGVVVGSASADMPTTIMKLFRYNTVPLSVTCESTLNIPNTDVMFVLDVTGSMKDPASSTDSTTKIDGLKQAVKDFYAALGPGAVSGPGRIRYGFVPYSGNVNVGRILYATNPSYIAGGSGSEIWHYQSRKANTRDDRYYELGPESALTNDGSAKSENNGDVIWENDWDDLAASGTYVTVNGTQYVRRYTDKTSSECSGYTAPNAAAVGSWTAGSTNTTSTPGTPTYPETSQTTNYNTRSTRAWRQYRYLWTKTTDATRNSPAKGACEIQYDDGVKARNQAATSTHTVTWKTRKLFNSWTYQNREDIDVSPFVQNSGAVANPVYYSYDAANESDPNNGAPSSFTWSGCIEEAHTVNDIVASSPLSRPSDAYDLDIDLKPSSLETKWKPFLRELQYNRSGQMMAGSYWQGLGRAPCPREASRLTPYASDYNATTKSSTSFNSYVDSLSPIGGTYHDIGLIWGARFLSPDGIFAADNSDTAAPGGYQISRHIVFMTDGTLDTNATSNDPWGITSLDGRVAPTSAANDTRNDETHNRRVQIICNQMKGKGFTIWVIGFGLTTLPQTLQDCASDAAHASVASDTATLRSRFAAIAQTIGGLRLSS